MTIEEDNVCMEGFNIIQDLLQNHTDVPKEMSQDNIIASVECTPGKKNEEAVKRKAHGIEEKEKYLNTLCRKETL